jgi:hypothetical protein
VGGLVVLGSGGIKPAKKGYWFENYDPLTTFIGCAANSAKKGEVCRTLVWNEPIYDEIEQQYAQILQDSKPPTHFHGCKIPWDNDIYAWAGELGGRALILGGP